MHAQHALAAPPSPTDTAGMKASDFARKRLNLAIVTDVSGSMDAPFDSYYYDNPNGPPEGSPEGAAPAAAAGREDCLVVRGASHSHSPARLPSTPHALPPHSPPPHTQADERKTKMEVAKEVLAGVVKLLAPEDRLALVLFSDGACVPKVRAWLLGAPRWQDGLTTLPAASACRPGWLTAPRLRTDR